MRAAAAAAAAAVALALAVALAACWTERAPQPPRMASTPVPGTLWVTPAQRWRTDVQPSRIAVAGATAMLAASDGWIARFDLERGEVARARRLPDLTIDQLVALPGGRWLLVGLRGRREIAATLDAATLEPTVVVTGVERPQGPTADYLHSASRAVVLDDGIALAVEGLPLAIYDPATWRVRRVVDPIAGWRWIAGAGRTLYASGTGGLARFDLAAGTRGEIEVPKYTYRVGGTATYLVTSASADGRRGFHAEGLVARRLIAAGDWSVAVDRAGDRIAFHDRATIHVHALADGKRVASYDLGESGHGRVSAMAFGDGRLVVAVSGVVRAIDLATGAITPAGDPPYGWGTLAVTDAGEVLSLGTHALRIADGKVVTSARIAPDEVAIGDPHQALRYGVLRKPESRRVELRDLGGRARLGSWGTEEDTISGVWLGRTGKVVIETDGIHAQRALLRGAGASLDQLTPINFDSLIHDVDVDGGYALIGVEGTAHVVRLRAAAALHELPHPGCDQYAMGRLERGGDRVLLNDGPNLVVFRRTTGARIGAARIEEADENTIAFVPGRDEILIAARDALVLWGPAAGALRRLGGLAGIADVQVSPDARRVALAFHDGRIALADLDVVRAAMTPGRPAPLPADAAKAECPSGDPFELDPDHQKDPDDLPDDLIDP